MSKTILSRFKPPFRPSKSVPLFTPHTKKIAWETIEILKSQPQYQDSLESLFDEHGNNFSDIAHHMFDKIADPELAIKFYDWASTRPTQLDGFAFSALLKLLAKSRVFSEIEVLLEKMKCKDIEPTFEALSAIIDAYANSGLVEKSVELYNYVSDMYDCPLDVLVCNSMLNALVKCEKVDTARKIYDQFLSRDGAVDNHSTCIMLTALCKEGNVEEGRKLVEARWGEGCLPNAVFYNILIHGYCSKRDVDSANGVFREMKLKGFLPTVETYGALVNGYCKEGNFKAIDRLLKEMRGRGLVVNVRIFNNIMDARLKHNDSKVAVVETFQSMIACGCESDIVTYNTLISQLCRDGKAEEARHLIEQAKTRNLIPNRFSYTPLIHLYGKQGEYLKASDLLIEMTEGGNKPDLVTYGALVHGLVSVGDIDVALTIKEKMVERRIKPDATIYNVLVSGLSKKGRFSDAKKLISEMLEVNILPDEFLCATLVDSFVRNNNFGEAKRLFELTFITGVDPGVVGYNAMIKGYCKFGTMKDARSCFARMMKVHHKPDEFTFSTLIDGYIKQNDMNGALRIFGLMIKRKCKPNVVCYTSLLNGFCRRKDFHKAEEIFNEMQCVGLEPNVVTYTILIGNFCKEGKIAKAVSFFELMLVKKCIPNNVTFNYLVNGFTNIASLVEEHDTQENKKPIFLEFYRKMISDGWSTRAACYSSILVSLCRNNMVESALRLKDYTIAKSFIPDSVSFAVLLYGLCLEGRLKEWNHIIQCRLSESELQVAIRYAQILNQYESPGETSETVVVLGNLALNAGKLPTNRGRAHSCDEL